MLAIMTDFTGPNAFSRQQPRLELQRGGCDTAERLKNLPRGTRDDANAEQIDAAQFLLGV